MNRIWLDRFICVGVTAVAIYLYRVTYEMPTFPRHGTLGPAYFPRLLLIGIIVSAIGLLLLSLLERASQPSPQSEETYPHSGRKLLLVVGLIFAYFTSMTRVGFLLSTVLFQAIFLLISFQVRNPRWLVGVPVALTSLLFLIFIKLMYVPLPRGEGVFRTVSLWFY